MENCEYRKFNALAAGYSYAIGTAFRWEHHAIIFENGGTKISVETDIQYSRSVFGYSYYFY